jgi:hypothetical protein
MAKKAKAPKLNSTTKRNLFIVAIVLITLGLLAFFMEYRSHKMSEVKDFEKTNEVVAPADPRDIGPENGCAQKGSRYVCDIKINNPSAKILDWSAVVEDIEGASVSENGAGSLAANSSTVVQLTVPTTFCYTNPDGKGKVTIMDSTKSTNQSEAAFNCNEAAK